MKRTLYSLFFAGVVAAQAQPARLTLEDLLSEGGGRGGRGGAALTPDGKYFAGTANGQVALTPVEGGSAVPFTLDARTEVRTELVLRRQEARVRESGCHLG